MMQLKFIINVYCIPEFQLFPLLKDRKDRGIDKEMEWEKKKEDIRSQKCFFGPLFYINY